MNKRVLIALAAVSVLVLVLIVWGGFVLLGYLWRQAPAVIEGGRGLLTETVRRADEMLPGVKEKIERAAPALSERAGQLWPGEAVPGQDVGGEDMPGVPRYAGLVRVAYGFEGAGGARPIGATRITPPCSRITSANWRRSVSKGRCWRQRRGRIFASIARRSKGCAWRSAGTTGRARMRSKWSSPRPDHERT